MAYNKCLFFSQNMGNPGIRNATLITERPSCLPTNGNLITLLAFIIGGKKKWCLNSSLSHQPPPPQPKREGLKKTGLVKGMTSVSKELMWHGKRAGRGQTGNAVSSVEAWGQGTWDPLPVSPVTLDKSFDFLLLLLLSAYRLLMKWIQFLKTGYENHFC